MDYYELYWTYNNYDKFLKMPIVLMCLAVIFGIACIVTSGSKDKSEYSLSFVSGVSSLFCVCFILTAFVFWLGTGIARGRVAELNKVTIESFGDTLENFADNVEYLSDKYNERLDHFRFVYGDNAPSRKEYINNILNEFYGQTVSSDKVNYRDEIKEVEQSLRKGVQ